MLALSSYNAEEVPNLEILIDVIKICGFCWDSWGREKLAYSSVNYKIQHNKYNQLRCIVLKVIYYHQLSLHKINNSLDT